MKILTYWNIACFEEVRDIGKEGSLQKLIYQSDQATDIMKTLEDLPRSLKSAHLQLLKSFGSNFINIFG